MSSFIGKFISRLFIISFFLSLSIPVFPALTDSEGMPIVYLRGEFGKSHWGVDEDYRFQRDGDTYTLTINSENPVPAGRFKIADEDWVFDFGGAKDDIWINSTSSVSLAAKGANLHTDGIYEGKITFKYTDGGVLLVFFRIDSSKADLSTLISGTLPVMYINVYTDEDHTAYDNEIIDYYLDHKDYFNEAEYWLDINGCKWMEEMGAESIGSADQPLPLQIKARGNWTRIGFSKKPFKIKLDKKANLLNLTPEKSKHYALLAHADDTFGYLRNFTAFNLGNRIGLPWTPGMQPVELVINGDYRGLYFLTESVRVGDGRIEIEELEDMETDPELISGGYVVELDNYDEENQIYFAEKSCAPGWHFLDRLRVTWDTPEEYSEIQTRFISDQFTTINDLVGENKSATWSYLDLDDAARYYLVWEIVSHTEAFHGSTYLFRHRGEGQKWHFSPLWDAGNAFRGNSDDFFYNCDPFGNTWIPSMRENKSFNDKVKETWLWFMHSRYSGIEDDLHIFASRISEAVKYDYKRWKGQPHPDGGQSVADNSDINSRLNEVLSLLDKKVSWLKKQFGDYTSGDHPEPSRDTTPAAALPDYAQAGIREIPAGDLYDSSTEYYTLQGLKVAHPKSGEIYIMKKGDKRIKVLFP